MTRRQPTYQFTLRNNRCLAYVRQLDEFRDSQFTFIWGRDTFSWSTMYHRLPARPARIIRDYLTT